MALDPDLRLVARTSLSAPSSPSEIRTLNQVILAVSVLSIVGAGWIMLSFCLFKQVRTFRHQLILGLAISDFWMAVNFLSSCAVNLHGYPLGAPSQKKFCSFNGFMTQLFVVQTDYWVLVIAICTFLILANHKSMSTWIQDHRLLLWFLPWALSTLWAVIGLVTAGYGDIGAWCWFTSDKVRLLANFIPRWLIIATILTLYARLSHIIHKAHTRFPPSHPTPHSLSHPHPTLEPHSLTPETASVTSSHRIARPSPSDTKPDHPDPDPELELDLDYSTAHSSHHYPPAVPASASTRLSSPTLKKLARQMMMYPLVYMLIWMVPTCVRIYQSVTGTAAPFGIATVDKTCIVIQGLADAIIYGINETSLWAWRGKFSKQHTTRARLGGIRVDVERVVRVESP